MYSFMTILLRLLIKKNLWIDSRSDEDFRFKYFSLILSHAPPCEQQARLGEEFREIRGNCSRYTQSVILTQGDNVSRDRSKTLKNRGPLYFHSPLA